MTNQELEQDREEKRLIEQSACEKFFQLSKIDQEIFWSMLKQELIGEIQIYLKSKDFSSREAARFTMNPMQINSLDKPIINFSNQ